MKITNLRFRTAKPSTYIKYIDWWHLDVDGKPMVYQAIKYEGGYVRSFFGTFFAKRMPSANPPPAPVPIEYVEVPYYLPLNAQDPQHSIERLYKLAMLQ